MVYALAACDAGCGCPAAPVSAQVKQHNNNPEVFT